MSRIHDALRKAEQEKTARTRFGDAVAGGRPHASGSPEGDRLPSPSDRDLSSAEQPRAAETPEGRSLAQEIEECCPPRSWKPDAKKMLFVDGQAHALGTEEFRTLRSHLYLIRDRQPLKRLLVTSPLPQDGKTFVAANLAQAIALQPERRVLLVDGDLRLPRLHESLRAPSSPGLSDYLAEEADEFSIVQRGSLENLYFIPAGTAISNSSELIGRGGLQLLFDRLAPAFDWIILDSPPAVPVSDANMMADSCDGVVLVIRAGVTPYDLAQKACRDFRKRGLVGVVLNGTDARQGYGYNYYAYYGKTYGKSGLGESKSKS